MFSPSEPAGTVCDSAHAWPVGYTDRDFPPSAATSEVHDQPVGPNADIQPFEYPDSPGEVPGGTSSVDGTEGTGVPFMP